MTESSRRILHNVACMLHFLCCRPHRYCQYDARDALTHTRRLSRACGGSRCAICTHRLSRCIRIFRASRISYKVYYLTMLHLDVQRRYDLARLPWHARVRAAMYHKGLSPFAFVFLNEYVRPLILMDHIDI